MSYLQYFKAISVKISEHHKVNPEFDSWSLVESPSCKHMFIWVGMTLTLDGVAINHVIEMWLDTWKFKSI